LGRIVDSIFRQLKSNLRSFAWRVKTIQQDWLWGRVACMGHDVLTLLDSSVPLINIQKGRVDYILDIMTDQRLKARPYEVAPFMECQDITSLIAQEGDLTWLGLRPSLALFTDSFPS